VRLYRRSLVVLEFDRGKPISAIAELVGMNWQSVYNWVAHFEQSGAAYQLRDAPRSGHLKCINLAMGHRLSQIGTVNVDKTSEDCSGVQSSQSHPIPLVDLQSI
jgi:hypothetical protein